MREISASAKTLFADARASHLKLPKPLQLTPQTPLVHAIDAMKRGETGCILICDGERLEGIFTERDLLNRVLGKEADPNAPIERFMTPKPITLPEDTYLVHVVDLMDEKGFRHIPLVNRSGEVTGLVSVSHIITYLAEHFPAEVYNLPPKLDQRSYTSEGG